MEYTEFEVEVITSGWDGFGVYCIGSMIAPSLEEAMKVMDSHFGSSVSLVSIGSTSYPERTITGETAKYVSICGCINKPVGKDVVVLLENEKVVAMRTKFGWSHE